MKGWKIHSVNAALRDDKNGIMVSPGEDFFTERMTPQIHAFLKNKRMILIGGEKDYEVPKADTDPFAVPKTNKKLPVNPTHPTDKDDDPGYGGEDNNVPAAPDAFTQDDAENLLNQNTNTTLKNIKEYKGLTKENLVMLHKAEVSGKKRKAVLGYIKGMIGEFNGSKN